MFTPTSQQSSSANSSVIPPPAEKENRRIQRISLPLPARIEVRIDHEMSWNEVTRLNDVSAFGCGFSIKRPVKRGRLVMMTIPMPRQLRSFDYSEPQYKVWGVVRRCIPVGRSADQPEYSVGVAFTGKRPPPGYLERPSMLFDIAQREASKDGMWQLVSADLMVDDTSMPKELRKQTRYFIPEPLVLEQIDAAGNVIVSESTVTENISLGGAAVFTTLKAEAGSFIRVTSERFAVSILSIVRTARIGPDGITRLHIEFIDRLFPLEGIG